MQVAEQSAEIRAATAADCNRRWKGGICSEGRLEKWVGEAGGEFDKYDTDFELRISSLDKFVVE